MFRLGREGGLYYNAKWIDTDPTYYTNPSWLEVLCVRNLTLVQVREEREISPYRPGRGTYRAATLINPDTTIQFEFRHNFEDVRSQDFLDRLIESHFDDKGLDMWCVDYAIVNNGGQGVRTAMQVANLDRAEPLGATQQYRVRLRQTIYPDGPSPGILWGPSWETVINP